MKITVYYINTGNYLQDDLFWKAIALIPKSLHPAITRYRQRQDQWLTLAGKLLLQLAIQNNVLPDSLTLNDLRHTDHNRPYLHSTQDFNISHSGEYTLLGISHSGRLGIDIERIQPIDNREIEGVFTITEREKIAAERNSNRILYKFWTRKEAAIKCIGEGLQLPLDQIDVTGSSVMINGSVIELTEISIDENYCVHIASDFPLRSPVELKRIDLGACIEALFTVQPR